MKRIFLLCAFIVYSVFSSAQDVPAKDYSLPEASEIWEPKPGIVTPGEAGGPPSDAIILFSGGDLDSWVMSKDGSPCEWEVKDDVMTTLLGSGDIQTKQQFGDCQLHIEFMLSPDEESVPGHYNAGNSGVYLQERYELQIYDSYQDKEEIYANGQCGSLYKQAIPLANASSKTGEWNTYDIYYTAPAFRPNGSVEKPAYITVVHNGVLILNHFEIQGTIQHAGIPQYEPHGKAAVRLQEHGSKVSFRNVWIREL